MFGPSRDTQARRNAVRELTRLGVSERGSVRVRGSFSKTADHRLSSTVLQKIALCLADSDSGLRCQAALALGEWGGPDTILPLQRLLEGESDQEVQLYCITALRILGGSGAIVALNGAMQSTDEAVCAAAISAIEDLVLGGRRDDTELYPAGTRITPRIRAVQHMRERRRPLAGEPMETIGNTLWHIATGASVSDYLRIRADELLALIEG